MIDEHLSVAERSRAFSSAELERIRIAIDPGSTVAEVRPLSGGVDTATYALRLTAQGSAHRDVVVRVYRRWKGDVHAKVEADFATLRSVSSATSLAPRPILCDAAGELVGEPLVVLTMFEGAPMAPPPDARAWVEQLAAALVEIHGAALSRASDVASDRTPGERIARRLANPPPSPDPLWDEVVGVLPALADRLVGNPGTLLHGDFWFGNTVWHNGRLRGVIDWGGARIGDPATDVAGARADLRLFAGERAADIFLKRYQDARGRLNDLLFWDLLTALDPLRWLDHWITGYEELGVPVPFAEARSRLERWVRSDLGRVRS
jgi:aminoglycoside phosphotransferase (APT) family kinase protein